MECGKSMKIHHGLFNRGWFFIGWLGDFAEYPVILPIECQPWINKTLDCLIGRVPFMYWMKWLLEEYPPN